MRLSELAGSLVAAAPVPPAPDPDISGLAADSRLVRPGYLFAALPGTRADGRRFIPEALARGAVAVLALPGTALPPGSTALLVSDPDPRRCLALLAARFHAPQPALAAAVTGTNGKTSVAWFARRIWERLGRSAAALGTLGVLAPANAAPAVAATGSGPGLTTADPVTLHRTLAALARAGVDRVIVEASSHGLVQARLDGLRLAAGGFTGLTRDHLDYHRTMDAYRAAKLRLFDTLLPPGAAAVLDADSADFPAFAAVARARGLRLIGYGRAGADLRLDRLEPDGDGQRLGLTAFGRAREVVLPLPGAFQARNALCAAGLVIACGEAADAALEALAGLDGVPGRLQRVAVRANGAPVYVDYAHTPDALAAALSALRPHTRGRLVAVFGCGGDRDPGKRPLMGAVARDLADRVLVTDDNPRGEPPAAIRRAILTACPDAEDVGDRAEAIARAVRGLEAGDVLVIAGKGHETGQVVADRILPFDDAAVARAAVAAADGDAA